MGTSFLASATSAAAAMPTCPWASRWHLAPLPIRGERAVGGRVGGRDWPRGDTCRSWRWGPGRSRTGLRLWVNVPLTYKTSFDADRQGVEDFGRHARCRSPLRWVSEQPAARPCLGSGLQTAASLTGRGVFAAVFISLDELF